VTLRFHKMHGLGNDFVVIDARATPVPMDPDRARAIADRREGIGCDQVIVIESSDIADARMRIWNADGGEVAACGNASRAVALLLSEATTLETGGGLLRLAIDGVLATVDMGLPRFDWGAIPLAYAMDTRALPVGWDDLAGGQVVNVGNPHIVFFVDNWNAIDLERLGPEIEHDALFPERINVNVATVEAPDRIRLRVWERGAGLTRACGTGACATAVAAIRSGLVETPVTVVLPGGELLIDWAPGRTITMSGPAAHVFTGETDEL
jgi:diaminopimelate epimerase